MWWKTSIRWEEEKHDLEEGERVIRGRKGEREGGEEVGGGPIASSQSTDGSLTPTELSTGQGNEKEAGRKKD